jgi:hypothetical protein
MAGCRAAAERAGAELARLRAELARLEAQDVARAAAEAEAREQEQEGEPGTVVSAHWFAPTCACSADPGQEGCAAAQGPPL